MKKLAFLFPVLVVLLASCNKDLDMDHHHDHDHDHNHNHDTIPDDLLALCLFEVEDGEDVCETLTETGFPHLNQVEVTLTDNFLTHFGDCYGDESVLIWAGVRVLGNNESLNDLVIDEGTVWENNPPNAIDQSNMKFFKIRLQNGYMDNIIIRLLTALNNGLDITFWLDDDEYEYQDDERYVRLGTIYCQEHS